MNDRWFNFAMALAVITILINGFLLMAAAQPNQNNQYSALFNDLGNNKLNYTSQKTNSTYLIGQNDSMVSNSSASPTSDQGFTPVTDASLNPFAFTKMLDIASVAALGFEMLMLKLAGIFIVAAPLFLALAAMGFLSKTILIAWLTSVVLRPLLGRVW